MKGQKNNYQPTNVNFMGAWMKKTRQSAKDANNHEIFLKLTYVISK